jgi:dienelactone hydrolase
MIWYFGVIGQITLLTLVFSSNCSTTSHRERSSFKLDSFSELRPYVFSKKPDTRLFMRKGPFSYRVLKNFEIRVTKKDVINTDIYFSKHDEKAPLIIFQHGNLADKDAHRNQARRIASWGMHAMIISQPNKGRWIRNGLILGKLVRLLYAWPELLDKRFDPKNIILTGHSFGGSAAAMVAGSHAPIKGAIFLDPALVDKRVRDYIRKIKVPTIVLGADRRIFKSRKRQEFYKLIKRNAVEISVRNATHNDAQNPAIFSIAQFIGLEHATSRKRQAKFTAAIIASAFSLASTGSSSFAWSAFQPGIKRGELIEPQRK